jgi:hypothetical protein
MEKSDKDEILVLKRTEHPALGDRFLNGIDTAFKWAVGVGGTFLVFGEWSDKYIVSPIMKNLGKRGFQPATADNYKMLGSIATVMGLIAGAYSFLFKKKETEITLTTHASSAMQGLKVLVAQEEARRSSPEYTKKLVEERQTQGAPVVQK